MTVPASAGRLLEDGGPVAGDERQALVDLHDRQLLQHHGPLVPQRPWAEAPGPAWRGDQYMLLVAERGRGEQTTARTGRRDGQVMVSGGQPLQRFLGAGEEGTAQGQALRDERGERGQGPHRCELGRSGQMQRPYARLLVELRLGDLDQRVQMGRRPVREFVADGRRGHTAGPAQEERAAQLPLQGPDL